MPTKRTLPERRNALIEPENSPSHEVLVDRRRLGQTNLAVKAGSVGVSNASKAENLGTFDYAHLRVPLPKDLSGSGIFTLKTTTSYPESYFLMRRSNDGNISATGMFKAAFPWASLAEEETERRYQKSFASAGSEEVAGSVWISPKEALELADEYGMRLWILALLDPRPIEKGQKDRNNPHIDNPPRFDLDAISAPMVLPPSSSLRPTRARSSRSVSPSKVATPNRKMASPRKSRTTRAAKAAVANGEEIVERATRASSALQNVFENGTTASESVASESVNGDFKEPNVMRIEVHEKDELNGENEMKDTKVTIDVPADHPELPTPEDPTKLIEEARKMVEAARKLEGDAATSSKSKSKRKAEELVDEDEVDGAIEERPAKQARLATALEQQAKKDRVLQKTFIGVTAMAVLGYAASFLS